MKRGGMSFGLKESEERGSAASLQLLKPRGLGLEFFFNLRGRLSVF